MHFGVTSSGLGHSGSMIPEEGVTVAGGVVKIDLLRGAGRFRFWLRIIKASLNSYSFSTRSFKRDLLVLDATTHEVLYREGPYDGTTVSGAFWDVVAQIKGLGVDDFIAVRTHEAAQSGSRTALNDTPGDVVTMERAVQYNFWRLRGLFRRRDRT